ncbi:MAG TPA: MBL fold metallo-hydrolase [Actinomycetes bacterium]|nr:MBL fold metallo-hydrolase [Actinomycetes bacterium]
MTRSPALPEASSAELHVLFEGYVGGRVASTVVLVVDGDARIVVDPGMVPGQRVILDPLARHGVDPSEVTDVVLSHHHPDHTLNAGLFPRARFHDHWAIYQDDRWGSRPAEGAAVSPSVRLAATPGHSPQDITTLVATAEGLAACTHLWWSSGGPADDPYAPDRELLRANRRRVLEVASLIVPGHGPAFRPDGSTPL